MATLLQPPYSPRLAQADFFPLPRFKSSLRGCHFETVKKIQAVVTSGLKEIPVQDFQASYDAWQRKGVLMFKDVISRNFTCMSEYFEINEFYRSLITFRADSVDIIVL